jgi:hypothetical protein
LSFASGALRLRPQPGGDGAIVETAEPIDPAAISPELNAQ